MRTRLVVIALTLFALQFPATSRAQWVPDGAPVCSATAEQSSPVAVSDGASGAIIAWVDKRNGANGDIYAQRMDPYGHPLWTINGVAICTEADTQSNLSILADGSGGAIIAWMDYRPSPGGAPDIYAQRINASGTTLWTADGVMVCGGPGIQEFPSMAPFGSGGAFVMWFDDRSGSHHDVYAGRVTPVGFVPDGNGVAITNTPALDEDPEAIVSVSPGALITWIDRRNGNFDIYGARFSNTGLLLDPLGIAICTDISDQYYQAGIPDGSGGAIVAWMDVRLEATWAQRINSAGVVQWAANGVAIGSPLGSVILSTPQIVTDGAGGAIIAWPHYDGANLNLYAQRVNGAGGKLWAPSEVAICTATGSQQFGAMVSDGAGGAIMAWNDSRANPDIYAQRVGSGAVAWTTDGVPVCTNIAGQNQSVVVSDGQGGAITVWTDARSADPSDIYALRIGSNGNRVTGVGNTPPAALAVLPAEPNPFQGTTRFEVNLEESSQINVHVYDVNGRLVRSMETPQLAAGPRSVTFDARDDRGHPLAAGVYFARVEAAHASRVEKLVVLK